MNETVIEKFKDYYFDYRKTSAVDESFSNANEALSYYVIDTTERLANREDLEGIKSLVRQYQEIHNSTYGSNDSVKERFEREYQESS